MPKVIDHLYDQVKSYTRLKWVGIYINCILPIIGGIFAYALAVHWSRFEHAKKLQWAF